MKLLAAVTTASLLGCGAATAPRSEPVALVSTAPVVAERPAPPPRPAPFCPAAYRADTHLQAAWPVGERTHFCVSEHDDSKPRPDDGSYPVHPDRCASVGPDGDYRVEPAGRSAPPPLPKGSLSKTSRDGALSFSLRGGEREPKGARGTLRRHGKVLRSGAVTYDEHVALEGWVGNSVVLRTWVDEGPGCSLVVIDPLVHWPSGLWNDAFDGLGGCWADYDLWRPTPDRFVMLDGDGSSVTFVEENPLRIEAVQTGRQSEEYEAQILVPWLEGDDLVLVYGSPIAGDVLRLNLRTRAIHHVFSPPPCVAPPPP